MFSSAAAKAKVVNKSQMPKFPQLVCYFTSNLSSHLVCAILGLTWEVRYTSPCFENQNASKFLNLI